MKEVLELRQVIQRRTDAIVRQGFQIDWDHCRATDPNGEVTSLDTLPKDLADLTGTILKNSLSFSFEHDLDNFAFKRGNLVAICSVGRVVDYWAQHPSEIPSSDRIEDYLYFDVEEGKPKESYITAAFLRAVSMLLKSKSSAP